MDQLKNIPEVEISPSGTFKYVLIQVVHPSGKKIIVRGDEKCTWHADIFEEAESQFKKLSKDLKLKCLGGGRINFNDVKRAIHIYGYSQGYGKADHEITCKLIKEAYPDCEVTWSDEGY